MKRIPIVLVAALLALLSLPLLAVDPPAGGAPRLEAQTEVDLGDVVRGTVVTAVFPLRNAGTGMLQILNAKPG